jgi:hypothetical protein
MKAFFQIKSHLKFPEFFERKGIILAQGALCLRIASLRHKAKDFRP